MWVFLACFRFKNMIRVENIITASLEASQRWIEIRLSEELGQDIKLEWEELFPGYWSLKNLECEHHYLVELGIKIQALKIHNFETIEAQNIGDLFFQVSEYKDYCKALKN